MKSVTSLFPLSAVAAALALACSPAVIAAHHSDHGQKVTPEMLATQIVKKMSITQRLTILVGPGYGYDGNNALKTVEGTAGYINGLADEDNGINLPAAVLSDGPAGIRIDPTRDDDSGTYYATAFPVGTLLASSWDTALVEKVGEAVGEEARAYGVDFWLAPGMNIQRNPLNGRNFEYFSEDPLVAGKIAAAETLGVQSQGVGVTIKHFVANNSETNRMNVDNIISPRALREIYLRGFKDTVETVQPWALMTSYNKVNGTYTSQHHDLITDILRNEWGFKGLVMSDWYAGDSALDQENAGNDLLQPGGTNSVSGEEQLSVLEKAYSAGTLTEKTITENAIHIVTQMIKTPSFIQETPSNSPDLDAHATLSKQAAEESMVLLKNDASTLPLYSGQTVASFGIAQYTTRKGGTGSGDVHSEHTINIADGLAAEFTVDSTLEDLYSTWYSENRTEDTDSLGISTIYYCDEPELSDDQITRAAKTDSVAVISLSRLSGEGSDRTDTEGDYLLSTNETDLISRVSEAFHAQGKKVVVILNVPGVIDTESWKSDVDSILLAYMPGQEAGTAIAEILAGVTNPSGKLAQTFPKSYSDVPSADSFDGVDTDDDGTIDTNYYDDGIMVGYRYYSSNDVDVSYPFAYGLSYTNFSYSHPRVVNNNVSQSKENGSVELSVTITNTGNVAGKEIAEVYVAAPQNGLTKPNYELKAFNKTHTLQPGRRQTLDFVIPTRWLASFDAANNQWIVASGSYKAYISPSSDISQITPVTFRVNRPIVIPTTANAMALPSGISVTATGGVVTP
ncbi:beta-glucosidase [Vibrio sp. CAIM 722]|uniref:Beta-glucosidase n=1 Tax=Vibrio eleionomae TaxID=2653505 RepID=A0A7X4LM02_9VIBR|nr:glycoside hydrolase family 3 C-terminal domain-containing protein [Vibrio eleionomae]MZI94438.1 beta-glucosidase [Vibrio eleionomae]